jgi:hypothetical protein
LYFLHELPGKRLFLSIFILVPCFFTFCGLQAAVHGNLVLMLEFAVAHFLTLGHSAQSRHISVLCTPLYLQSRSTEEQSTARHEIGIHAPVVRGTVCAVHQRVLFVEQAMDGSICGVLGKHDDYDESGSCFSHF